MRNDIKGLQIDGYIFSASADGKSKCDTVSKCCVRILTITCMLAVYLLYFHSTLQF